jgi:hypothetical protein
MNAPPQRGCEENQRSETVMHNDEREKVKGLWAPTRGYFEVAGGKAGGAQKAEPTAALAKEDARSGALIGWVFAAAFALFLYWLFTSVGSTPLHDENGEPEPTSWLDGDSRTR